MAVKSDLERYRINYRAEQEGALLYQELAKVETDAHLAELYRRMAEAEQRHAAVWAERLRSAGQSASAYTPGWRIRALVWMAKRFGVSAVLPTVSTLESDASRQYDEQPEARAAGMPAEERSHARLFRAIQTSTPGGIAGPVLARFEGRHRNTGGNALRAAVLGASDGLTTNLSLVMGVAGANLPGHTILFTGLAGMLAGALSMSIGEWLSVQSARELYIHQIAVERQELADVPEEEQEELSLIYQAKGIDPETAGKMAESIIGGQTQGGAHAAALDTLVREELGIDPKELGGSAWEASLTSFLLFAVGAIIPVIPFVFGSGWLAVLASLLLGILGLFIIGVGITLTTGAPLLKSGGRQVLLGVAASAITFALGWLVGGRLG
ncbi:MAG TPA: demethoxyubiquinone hydroxylase family protein [Ktedonobacteraceae bacterium]|nr:demethoxyubiquinone hydroxylase family protein [Ktedonobacteraceae bacterium]